MLSVIYDNINRIYFNSHFRSTLTIKLIKGENLPLITEEETKAFVSVRVISQQVNDFDGDKNGGNYKRTYTFTIASVDFFSYSIHFEISRFNRYSRKFNVGHVMVSLGELGVDISNREVFFVRSITAAKTTQVLTPIFSFNSLHALYSGPF